LQAAAGAVDTIANRPIRYRFLLTFQWLSTGVAVLVAVLALLRGRRLAKRLERLTESYWELRYDHGQLRARLARIEGQPEADRPAAGPQPGSTSFIPLASLKASAPLPAASNAEYAAGTSHQRVAAAPHESTER
jgi:hypothetical protein